MDVSCISCDTAATVNIINATDISDNTHLFSHSYIFHRYRVVDLQTSSLASFFGLASYNPKELLASLVSVDKRFCGSDQQVRLLIKLLSLSCTYHPIRVYLFIFIGCSWIVSGCHASYFSVSNFVRIVFMSYFWECDWKSLFWLDDKVMCRSYSDNWFFLIILTDPLACFSAPCVVNLAVGADLLWKLTPSMIFPCPCQLKKNPSWVIVLTYIHA